MSVAALTRRIKEADTPQELFEIIALHGGKFDMIHTTASIMRLAKMDKLVTQEVADSTTFSDLLAFLEYQVCVMDPRGLQSTVWSLARMNQHTKVEATQLLDAVVEHAKTTMEKFDGPDLNGLMWGLAQLHHKDDVLMDLVARRACKICRTVEPRVIAGVAWAVAELQFYDEELMETLAHAAKRKISKWSLQYLSTMASSFTRLNKTHKSLAQAMTSDLAGRSWDDDSSGAWLDRARILLAASRAGVRNKQFLDLLSQHLDRRALRASTAYVTASMLWACRRLRCEGSHPGLFSVLEDSAAHLRIEWGDMDRAEFLDAIAWNRWFSGEFARRRGLWVPEGPAAAESRSSR